MGKSLNVLLNVIKWIPPLCILGGFVALLAYGGQDIHTLMLVGAAIGLLIAGFLVSQWSPLRTGGWQDRLVIMMVMPVMGAFVVGGLGFLLQQFGLA